MNVEFKDVTRDNIVGMTIHCRGISVTVKEYNYFSYNYEWQGNQRVINGLDLEFKDTNNVVRYWKSDIDGGHITK